MCFPEKQKLMRSHVKFLERMALAGVYHESTGKDSHKKGVAEIRLAVNNLSAFIKSPVGDSFYVDPFGRHWSKENLDEAMRLLRRLKDDHERLSFY